MEHPRDHIFGDTLRTGCDSCWINDQFISLEMFEERLKKDRSLDSILTLFDGIQPDETRFRWDKVIAFHLLLLAFINRFGYESQRSTRQEFLKVAQQARHPRILRNLVQSVDKLGLGKDPEISHIRWAIEMIDKRQESK